MNPFARLKQERFVGRDAEKLCFGAMLAQAEPEKPVTIVWGEGGMGKSTLLETMMQASMKAGLTKADLLWNETRNQDYLAVMCKLRDDLGAEHFTEFNSLVDFYTVPKAAQAKVELVVSGGRIVVGENLQNRGTIGSMTGVQIENVEMPRAELGISPEERMARLTDRFLRDLQAFVASKPVILFLDAYEKASEITRNWVCNELVGALFDDRLENVRIVVSGRIRPNLPDDRWLAINEMHLAPLTRSEVLQYVVKCQVPVSASELNAVVNLLLLSTRGNPGNLAGLVQAFIKDLEQQAA